MKSGVNTGTRIFPYFLEKKQKPKLENSVVTRSRIMLIVFWDDVYLKTYQQNTRQTCDKFQNFAMLYLVRRERRIYLATCMCLCTTSRIIKSKSQLKAENFVQFCFFVSCRIKLNRELWLQVTFLRFLCLSMGWAGWMSQYLMNVLSCRSGVNFKLLTHVKI